MFVTWASAQPSGSTHAPPFSRTVAACRLLTPPGTHTLTPVLQSVSSQLQTFTVCGRSIALAGAALPISRVAARATTVRTRTRPYRLIALSLPPRYRKRPPLASLPRVRLKPLRDVQCGREPGSFSHATAGNATPASSSLLQRCGDQKQDCPGGAEDRAISSGTDTERMAGGPNPFFVPERQKRRTIGAI
jgi:hypothetical protein